MVAFRVRSAGRASVVLAAAWSVVALAACSSAGDTRTVDTAASASAVRATGMSDTMTGMKGMKPMDNMSGMANMTGDVDHDFLRMMSDHHKGMIAMAHMTKERTDAGPTTADATKMDAAQDKELDQMMSMLEKNYKDPYVPHVMPDNRAMIEMMREKKGTDYARAFYENTIKHHQAAVKMVDEYLPKGRSATIKQMAEKMKADQTREIAEFQKKVGQPK